jgi:L-ascorbate metabolism protein UlaG (beta-lactamase superfamily)
MIKRIFHFLGAAIALIIITGVLFMFFSPQFGAKPTKDDLVRFEQSQNFNGQTFENTVKTKMGAEFGPMMETLWQYIKGNPNRTPKKGVVQVIPVTPSELENSLNQTRILWFGHSSFMLQTEGKNFLFDPMFSDVPAPHPWLGTSRYSGSLPIKPEDLPEIDAVFISHDHYDHLDLNSIRVLNSKSKHFYAPLGVSSHLVHWGVDKTQITEFDWWDEATLDGIKIVFTPARHFSGRGLSGQNQTLWGSWLLKGNDISLFFSGDTGYGTHFDEIYQRHGAVDFALLECGQYNKNWADIHMLPEQTAQAAKDLHAKVMMPVHWGAFTLSLHDWYDPAVRVQAAADELNQPIVIPQIGELMLIDDEPKQRNAWWENMTAAITNEGKN